MHVNTQVVKCYDKCVLRAAQACYLWVKLNARLTTSIAEDQDKTIGNIINISVTLLNLDRFIDLLIYI